MKPEITFRDTARFTDSELIDLDMSIDILFLLEASFDPNKLFSLPYNQWKKAYSPVDLRREIKYLMDLPDVRDKDARAKVIEHIRAVKDVRKFGTQLKDGYLLFDANHSAPKALKRLDNDLGDFKDQIYFLPPFERNCKPVLKELDSFDQNPLPKFCPSSLESFLDTYRRFLNDIVRYLSDDQITLENHHIIRRRFRTFSHYFTFVSQVTGSEAAAHLVQFIDPVVVEMGKTQDQIFVLEHEGAIIPSEDTTTISSRHLHIIKQFIKLHRQSGVI